MTDQEWEELYRKTESRMKKAFKIILEIIVTIIIIIAPFWMSFVYRTEYKIKTITTSISPDGTHELILQAVGEAAWPFGPANGRLILMENQQEVSKRYFTIRDDGGGVRDDSWAVTWHVDYVEVILFGEEQFDEQILLYYDGREETKLLMDTAEGVGDEKQEVTVESDMQEESEMTIQISEELNPEDVGLEKLVQPYDKYAEVLKQIMQEHTDPNGRVYNVDERWGFENNAFAILDVDGDGREELIFSFNTGNLGSMCEVIYDYNAEKDILWEELAEWVDTTYYSNGFIKVSDSHNHGKDPEVRGIWPYTLYLYNVNTDSYQLQYYVTSWDRQINSENFPGELDTDGDGVLYYILEDGKTTEDADVQPMNRQEYDNWVKETLPEWCVMDVAYYPMAEESIQKYLESSLAVVFFKEGV
ncbi:MAG: hypothetical protein HDR04_03295 [Lachnospiraceae bacterium]|nr:hypothetical protein [Lachnospiraceae bacterium]